LDNDSQVCNQDLIIDSSILDEVWLPVRLMKTGKQLVVKTMVESIKNKKKSDLLTLLDSGCTRTCIDEEYAKSQRWPLQKITNPILVKYVDRSSMTQSKIYYMVDLQIKAAGVTMVTGALVTRLKSFKLFLGFNWLQAINPQIDWQQMTVQTREGQEPLVMRTAQEGPGPVPDYVQLFLEVFSEEGFEDLPPRCTWDHAIDLVEGSTPHMESAIPCHRTNGKS
jgi:hypothetical protein